MKKPRPPLSVAGAAQLFGTARRIVVKVGTSSIVGDDGVRSAALTTLAADVADLRATGRDIIIVSSGAVALGRAALGIGRSPRLDLKQAAAATGQPLLMRVWSEAFAGRRLVTAQLLLTIGDTESRGRWRNARATLDALLARGAVPVINENDSVATQELRYGDNDRLSARVAQLAGADLLVLLSDVDGLYSADPRRTPNARHIPFVGEIDSTIERLAGADSERGMGTGGMRTKLEAAKIASRSGCATLITAGGIDHPLAALAAGQVLATVFAPQGSPARAYKQWIAGSLSLAGTVLVNRGAIIALHEGKSLLPSGGVRIDGEFSHGACVGIVDETGVEIARGLVRYGAGEARMILGGHSSDIAARLGYSRGNELVHRDDMVLT